jgi:16S rRNA (guanine966-N2)-methyltransferase
MRRALARNQLRIIGGAWRGRRIAFADVPGLRPTPDRVRETLFNWLAPVVNGSRCLDLFAGSGALGLEAASRGAAQVVLVEQDPEVVRVLQEEVARLKAHQVRVVLREARNYLGGERVPFDIAFLDPPFGSGMLPGIARALEVGGWLAPGARIYLEAERSSGLPSLPENWELLRSQRAGRVGYHLARRSPTIGVKDGE